MLQCILQGSTTVHSPLQCRWLAWFNDVRWRSLVTWYWKQQSRRWFCSTCTMIGWRQSRLTQHSVVWFWSCVQCMSTMIGPRWFSSPTRRPSPNLTTSGRPWRMKNGSRLKSSSRIWSLLTMARRTSEIFCGRSCSCFIVYLYWLWCCGMYVELVIISWKHSVRLCVHAFVFVCLCMCVCLSLRSYSHFYPGESELAGFIDAKDDGNCDDNCSYKTCKAPVKSHHQHNPTPNFLHVGCPSCCPTNSAKALCYKK